MKNKKIFDEVRAMIDERELDETHLENAHEMLLDLTEKDASCGWAHGLLAEICYWWGEYSDPADKLSCFQEGVDHGKQGVAVEPDSLEANFWLAVNYGNFGQEKGIMQSLALINPIKQHCERVLGIDERYFYGGPHRVIGRLYTKAPGFPLSIGNTKKGIEHLEKAVEIGPKFYLNRIFLAEAYIANRDKENARAQLQWILDAPLNTNHELEDEDYKVQAEALLNLL